MFKKMACLPVWDVLLALLGRLHVLPGDSEIYKMNLRDVEKT